MPNRRVGRFRVPRASKKFGVATTTVSSRRRLEAPVALALASVSLEPLSHAVSVLMEARRWDPRPRGYSVKLRSASDQAGTDATIISKSASLCA